MTVNAQPASFFAEHGFFVEPQFLPLEACGRIARLMDAAPRAGEPVYTREGERHIDPHVRLTERSFVGVDLVAELDSRFEAIKPRIESCFRTTLSSHQEPQFLIYRPGDHFAPHTDAAPETESATFLHSRRVTAVVFLTDTFSGGELTFHHFSAAEPPENPTALAASAGLLIAFRSELVHSVRPVTHGIRRTIVTWYCL